jgi:tRNA threonylcarbamoyladenosine biosynthesis protein TsaB
LAEQLPYTAAVKILALDTSSPTGSIAVLENEEVVGVISTRTEEAFSSRIFRHLEFLLEELSLSLNEFDLFSVVAGPGSFTGLRVGITAVKGWSEVFGKPIAAVSGLEALVAQSHSGARVLVPVTDARRGQFYFAVYERDGARNGSKGAASLKEEGVATSEELMMAIAEYKGQDDLAILTPLPELLFERVPDLRNRNGAAPKISIERTTNLLAPLAGQLGYLQAQRGQLTESLTLDANYIRRSDAEMNWKGPRDR